MVADYTGACSSLNQLLSKSVQDDHFDAIMAELDSELPSLASQPPHLCQAHQLTAVNRNRSKLLAPVNQLPIEILTTIFHRSVRHCTSSRVARFKSIETIASVCVYWHQIAINTPSLWSHIDLVVHELTADNSYYKAKLRAERSKNRLLYIHITDPDDTPENELKEVPQQLAFLASLAKQTGGLQIYLPRSCINLIAELLICWAKSGSPEQAHLLDIHPENFYAHRSLPLWAVASDLLSENDLTFEQLDMFFRSIKTLRLYSIHVPHSSLLYHGLSELRLESFWDEGEFPLTSLQLMKALEASPALRVLKLIDVDFSKAEGHPPTRPVVLAHLELLALYNTSYNFLPCICPGTLPLSLIITLPRVDDPASSTSIASFFSRSKVKVLRMIEGIDKNNWYPILSGSLKYLEELKLVRVDCHDTSLQDLFISRGQTWWPRLRVLHLVFCDLRLDSIVSLISCLSLRTIRVYASKSETFRQPRGERVLLHSTQIQALLAALVPDTVATGELPEDFFDK